MLSRTGVMADKRNCCNPAEKDYDDKNCIAQGSGIYGMRPLYKGNRGRHNGAELGVESARTLSK